MSKTNKTITDEITEEEKQFLQKRGYTVDDIDNIDIDDVRGEDSDDIPDGIVARIGYEMTKNFNPQTFCAAMTLLIIFTIMCIWGKIV